MKLKYKKIFFIGLTLLIFACEKSNDDENDNQTETDAIVEVISSITSPTTWFADSVYLIKNHNFGVENTLTIQAGTVVKFTHEGPGMSVYDEGTIIAIGTSDKPIVFTSFKDDTNGGDSNLDDDATKPAPGDWEEIELTSNGSQFSFCEFLYGGGGTYKTTLQIYYAKASVMNCLFAKNIGGKNGDFYYGVLEAMEADDETVIEKNVFYNNTLPLSIIATQNINNSNIFHNQENPAEVNTMNGIFVYDYDEVSKPTSWEEKDVPFVIYSNQFIVTSNAVLSLGQDVVLKFTNGSEMYLDEGSTSINQSAGNIFTSFKDDEILGDTNGDGDATAPSKGDWVGIYNNAIDIVGYYFGWTSIKYNQYPE